MTLAKPEWLKVRLPSGENYAHLKRMLRETGLYTVCEEANCPNIAECWGGGTATIMIMGDTCTRACRFCNVKTGNPQKWLDPYEPLMVAKALGQLDLEYVVVTSVDRDDLPDGGASHFADTIRAIKREKPGLILEVLIPDFRADPAALKRIVDARPDVVGHNIETTEALSPKVRDRRASYQQSLKVLETMKSLDNNIYTKSSIMLGLGESEEDVLQTMKDLRSVGVDFLTIGQYLKPGAAHRFIDVQEYVQPPRYEFLRAKGEELGFLYVASGPLVRSSYRAGEFYLASLIRRKYHHVESFQQGGE
ncbi:MAG: lipoyl synthase [Thaumarchaeota archaeon]|nr:lipoyl synthase [Nitrososphaerota archaeon]